MRWHWGILILAILIPLIIPSAHGLCSADGGCTSSNDCPATLSGSPNPDRCSNLPNSLNTNYAYTCGQGTACGSGTECVKDSENTCCTGLLVGGSTDYPTHYCVACGSQTTSSTLKPEACGEAAAGKLGYAVTCSSTCNAGLYKDMYGYCWGSPPSCGEAGKPTCSSIGFGPGSCNSCNSNLLACSNQCIDKTKDNNNCGSCGNVCNTGAGEVCQNGACVVTCAAPKKMCNGQCVDVNTDANNCGVCGNVCANLPQGRCASSAACSFGTCSYTCWGGWNGVGCGIADECQVLPTTGTPGQPNCDVKIKSIGAICNAGPTAQPVYDTTKLNSTGLPYGKATWSTGTGATSLYTCGFSTSGPTNGLPACIISSGSCPLNFVWSPSLSMCIRACGGNNQLTCLSSNKYIDPSTSSVSSVPEVYCTADNNIWTVPSTSGNITSYSGINRNGGGSVLCNNTHSQTNGDIVFSGGYIQLRDTRGVCCYSGAGSAPGDAWTGQIREIYGSYVSDSSLPSGQRFVCDDLNLSCAPPKCSCAGAPAASTVSCGQIIQYTPTTPSYCPELYCGVGTLNCPSKCGNGVVDSGEQCDKGASNGACPATCSASCTLNNCCPAGSTWDANAGGCIEIWCSDGVDNDGNIRLDYSGPSALVPQGDPYCPVSILGISAADGSVNQPFRVTCTANARQTAIVLTGAGSCSFVGWGGTAIANYDCVQGAPGSYTAKCSVNQTRSYQSGINYTATYNIACPANTAWNGSRCIEAQCANSVDDDGNGEADYDGFTSGTISPAVHGDIACPLSIAAISVPAVVPTGSQFDLNCTASQPNVRSIFPGGAGLTCSYKGAVGAKYLFNCTVPSIGVYSASCNIGTTISYQVGANLAQSFTAIKCDQDSDGYNRTDQPSVCSNGNDCNDLNASMSPGQPEQWATAGTCSDNFDNDCDGNVDYDGGYASPSGNISARGDSSCPVQPLVADVPENACAGVTGLNGNVAGNCTYATNVGQTRAKMATLRVGGITTICNFISWTGSTAYFNCPVGTATGAAQFNCTANASVSTLLAPNATDDFTLNGNSGLCDGSSCSPGVCQNTNCIICDKDCDLFNTSEYITDADPTNNNYCNNAVDCVDAPAGVTAANGSQFPGNRIYPGAPMVCGNNVNESCNACDPYCSLDWTGKLLNVYGDGIKGSVRVDGQNVYVATANDGTFTVSGIPNGTHNLSGNATGFEQSVVENIPFACINPVVQNLTLPNAQCTAQCTFAGYCDYKCLGVNGCGLGTYTPAEQATIKSLCQYAPAGSVRDFNSTHSFVCCSGPMRTFSAYKAPLTIQGCSRDLITLSRTVNYKGKILTLEIVTYNKCEE